VRVCRAPALTTCSHRRLAELPGAAAR
jgi:hypothetical protein